MSPNAQPTRTHRRRRLRAFRSVRSASLEVISTMQRRLPLIVACCLAFPIVVAAQAVSPDALLQKSRVAQDKAFGEMSKFYDCTAKYIERNISPNTTATEIADAAVASCNSHVTFYVGYTTASRFALTGAQRPQNWEEFERRTRVAKESAKVDGDRLVAQARGLGVKQAIELRAFAERARRKH
jgi:hypothetical protein